MLQTIIVLVIIAVALAFTARWTFKKLSGRETSCCGDKGESRPSCTSSMPSCCRPPELGGKGE
ncbi:MAG: hypothetical protein U5R49_16475 [Deltaproteobacteria bacterium]|nr:hypothetical protein [Deltaproteobacteria bacterium]